MKIVCTVAGFLAILFAFEAEGCSDNNSGCSGWARQGLCTSGQWVNWMVTNCKGSCGLCGGGSCADQHSSCSYWAGVGECSKNPGYMNTYCKKSCNKCTAPNTPAPPTPPPPTTSAPATQAPPAGSCGVSSFSAGRVIGGTAAQPGAWPWQVGLHTASGRFFCGGSLIKRDWIVTAAHCISSLDPNNYQIRLGDHNRNSNEGTEQTIRARRVIKHPNYDRYRLNNDIALIQLSSPATTNNRVKTVCLPPRGYIVPAGSTCYITGWGKIRHPGSSYHILQQAKIPPVSEAECKRKNGNGITNAMLCAGVSGTNLSGCHGDSGGPYVCREANGRWTLQGAVSWGSTTCSAQEKYTVFARLGVFRSWIDQHVN